MTVTELIRIPKEQLQEIPSFTQHIMKQMAAEEDKFYRQIMAQVLGREPEIEDAKYFTLAEHIDYPDRSLIAYKSVVLGRITKGWKAEIIVNAFTWSFEPGVTSFK
jgi:hypothetical protein